MPSLRIAPKIGGQVLRCLRGDNDGRTALDDSSRSPVPSVRAAHRPPQGILPRLRSPYRDLPKPGLLPRPGSTWSGRNTGWDSAAALQFGDSAFTARICERKPPATGHAETTRSCGNPYPPTTQAAIAPAPCAKAEPACRTRDYCSSAGTNSACTASSTGRLSQSPATSTCAKCPSCANSSAGREC